VVGVGVDTTGSTPIPVDEKGTPLALKSEFADNLDAMVVLWKDHTGAEEASEITKTAAKHRPNYLAKCGGAYSSEWFWSKIWRNIKHAPDVANSVYTWVEHADWLPAVLCGTTNPKILRRGICAAGHKAMFHADWGGYPDAEFLGALDERLVSIRKTLPDTVYRAGDLAGTLSAEWAAKTGLREGIGVSVGAFDAHLGAVGAGVSKGAFVKIIGTSTCDIMVAPLSRTLPDIPGLCGIVPESVLPGFYGLEAGQSAVGDIFNWFVNEISPGGLGHVELTELASKLKPGQSGLLALDWHNGNRTVLVDHQLSGGVIGLNLHTKPAELYRAWIEATAYGARAIIERFEEYGVDVERVIACGGISAKNPMVMQIYADVIGKPIAVSASTQTCALGSAIAGAVAAGAYKSFDEAVSRIARLNDYVYKPNPSSQAVYEKLYGLYRQLHDAFGVAGSSADLFNVMKELIDIRDRSLGEQ
jgi:L-ribulokinase